MERLLVLATRNQGKVQELKHMLADTGIEVRGLQDYPDCPEVEEDGLTFQDNAIKKARTISEFLQLPALADDSGLEVDALDGRPGVYSARFAGPQATDQDNNLKLLQLLEDIPMEKRQARFRCVLALALPGDSTVETWEGTCEGLISQEPRGNYGFGYDPLFLLADQGKMMAELTKEEKSSISHRGLAMKKMMKDINNLL
ncbi:XTP/dITP diphosphatase [Ammoniphilus sp. YIM 78166]|uniref:XTP/dITP diphosphatase n=1 Tax=Ammoniphilus sp. YIM 78166 TaxID=1644106 RepID=UPI00106F9369|nr:XTP/dITP diphosphatase [Ammoniphilus sp. YIM 78166]